MSEPMQIAEYNDEPDWLRISKLYSDLKDTTRNLHCDISQYNAALNEIDGLGIRVINGRERLSILREQIAQIEAKQ